MSVFTKISKRYKALTAKQFMLAGVFALAFAATIGAGFVAKQSSGATVIRDTNQANSIDNSYNGGGIGAADATELVSDINSGKTPDLKGIYAYFGLPNTDAARADFISNAKIGIAKQDGNVYLDDGTIVMTNAWSIGRSDFGYTTKFTIPGVGTYNKAMDTRVLRQNLPVMVLFDDNGVPQFIAMNACGNPVGGNKVVPTFECRALHANKVGGQADTYTFTTEAPTTHASVIKVEYFADGKLFDTQSNPSTPSKAMTFTKNTTVSVKVTISLPGGKTRVITSVNCVKKIVVVPKVCTQLIATSSDNLTFRFTMHTSQAKDVIVKSASFVQDGNVTAGVTDKDAQGNIFHDYTFSDDVQHTVRIKTITFIDNGENVVVTVPESSCSAPVTPKQIPPCTKNPNLPECKPPVLCEKGFPVGDSRCEELVHTGPAGTVGLFTGVSALGAAGHRLVARRRARRSE